MKITFKAHLVFAMAMATLGCGIARGVEAVKTAPIRVACLDVKGTAEHTALPKGLQRCLSSSSNFTFQAITASDIRSNVLSRFDVLICPGGSGSKQAKILDEEGRRVVREFVMNGGGYVGFCAGAYLASSHYSWSLGLLNASVLDTKHWARGTGKVKLKMTPEGCRLLGATNEIVTCYYGQGPLLAPGTNSSLSAYQTLAIYYSEVTKTNVPTGVMIGTTAIATGTCGKGRVLCFSPHPESGTALNEFVRRGVRWAAKRE
jgi:glutamine amidotransferase-like uncharacterized protein